MFIHTPKFLFVALVIMVAGLSAAYGQIESDARLSASIPFRFVLNDRTYPAGEYLITPSDEESNSSYLLELKGVDNNKTAFFFTDGIASNDVEEHSNLVFDKVGGQYFLSKIWVAGDLDGNIVPKTKKEREMINGQGRFGMVTETEVPLNAIWA